MFNNISPYYDFLNHFLSLGIDVLWRKKAVRQLRDLHPKQILDIATGTGDLAIEALSLKPEQVVGVDISEGMLQKGRQKLAKKGLMDYIRLELGDSENLPFKDDTFDAATAGFGVRNFENLEAGLTDIHRVLKPGGKLVVLEFSRPETFPVKQMYNFYFSNILPQMGRVVSKDQRAYSYLPESVAAFPSGKAFEEIMQKCGFGDTSSQPLTFGIASIYTGRKL